MSLRDWLLVITGARDKNAGMKRTANDDIEEFEPVLVAVGAHAAGQQVVHDDMGVIPQAVGRQEQFSSTASQHLQQWPEPQIL